MPHLHLKKVKDQVIVITGASSGIGLSTAQLAARKGAKVLLVSRNEGELQRICDEIKSQGGKATYVVADVADSDAVKRVADTAIRDYGGFDTWINNAGVSVYGKIDQTHLDTKRRLFDVNFWGVVNGCRAATPHLRERGGAIINLGSVVSKHSLTNQGIYAISKYAVAEYTDALRTELHEEGAPISLTLIKPGTIDTPYVLHARNPRLNPNASLPPVYAPEVVARAILRCAEYPVNHVFVGGAARAFSLLETLLPRFAGWLIDRSARPNLSLLKEEAVLPVDTLYQAPRKEGRIQGGYQGRVRKHSYSTYLALHPGVLSGIAGLFAGVVIAGVAGARRPSQPSSTARKEAA